MKRMKPYFFTLLLVLIMTNCRNKENTTTPFFVATPDVPSVILQDHRSFLKKLEKATVYQDSTGVAARKLYEVMEYHFREEEEYVFPPLGILPGISRGQMPDNSEEIFRLTEKFRKNEAVMLAEHQVISHYLQKMIRAAEIEGHQEFADFHTELEKHAALEEQILFPTVLMIGDYLKQRSDKAMEE